MWKPSTEQFRLASGHSYIVHYVEAPPHAALVDMFRPEFWTAAGDLVKPPSFIRVRATDDSFDVMFRVLRKPTEGKGLVVDLWPRFQGTMTHAELQAAGDLVKTVLKTSTIGGKPVPRVEPHGREGWRVIGIAGEIVSTNHRGEAEANLAMTRHMTQLGIKTIVEPEPVREEPKVEAKPEPKAKAAKAA